MARPSPITALLLLVAATAMINGCSPLLPLLGAALGGPAEKSQLAGPFAGTPSATQNSPPAASPVSDALAGAEQHVRSGCLAKLPPPEPPPETGCAMRPTCLPGSDQPIRLRLCSGDTRTASSEAMQPALSEWRWGEDSVAIVP